MVKNIKISDWLKELLDEFKKVEGHRSYDSVVRSLIPRALFEKSMLLGKEPMLPNMTKSFYEETQHEKLTEEWKEILKKQIRGKGR